ncbi:MAG: hypothetical protein WD042_12460 [Phycisphaeraceae bacterium]
MNSDRALWPTPSGVCSHHGPDPVPCELCVSCPAARTVALTGSILDGSGRLIMACSQPWTARLLLCPGTYHVRVHITQHVGTRPWRETLSRCWDVAFEVPPLSQATHGRTQLRVWLGDAQDDPEPVTWAMVNPS